MTAQQLRDRARSSGLVLLPVGSIEQHAPHLPTGVHALLAAEAANRIAARLTQRSPVVVAPTLWWGPAEHHLRFGGTLTFSLPTYYSALRDICRSIMRAGFTRIAIIAGHGATVSALDAIVDELTAELPGAIVVATYLTATADEVGEILGDRGGVPHACQGETSMMLVAHPDLVHTDHLRDAHGPEYGLRSDNVPVYHRHSHEEITESGMGAEPPPATAEEGERLLTVCAHRLADLLTEPDTWRRAADSRRSHRSATTVTSNSSTAEPRTSSPAE